MIFIPSKQMESISDVVVKIKERDSENIYFGIRNREYHLSSLIDKIDCSNTLCYGGGFEVGEKIREMLNKNESKLNIQESCCGQNSSKKGQSKHSYCTHVFEVQIEIELEV